MLKRLTASYYPITGLPEDDKVQTPAFTDAVRLYRQAQGHYGTWEMMCGVPSQVRTWKYLSGILALPDFYPVTRDKLSAIRCSSTVVKLRMQDG